MSPKLLKSVTTFQGIGVVLVCTAALLWWPHLAAGALAGGLLMMANFWFLRTLATRIFDGPADKKKAVYAVLLGAKFMFVLAALALHILVVKVHPLGIALGMSSLFVGLAGATVQQALAPQPQS